MNFCFVSPLNVETCSVVLAFTVCLTLFRTPLDIQFVPEPESKSVLILKYLPLLARTGTMIVGDIDVSACFAVLIIWMVEIT